jgi:hypothetical protein
MTERSSTRRRAAAVLLAVSLLAACGSDGDDGDAASTTSAAADGSSTTVGDDTDTTLFTPPEAEFTEADARVRFVNVFSDGGADSNLDFSWGGFSGREEAASLAYGEVSELLDARLLADPFASEEPESGTIDLSVAVQRTDAAEDEQVLMADDETVSEGQELIWVVGSDEDTMSEGATTVNSQWIFVDGGDADVPEPAAGKASLFLVSTGVGHLANDFITMGAPGACLTFQNDSGGGNAGPVWEVDPGSMQIGIYDANGGCTEPTGELVSLEAEAGHRYLVVAFGHTQQTRTAVIIDLDE